MTAGRRIDLNSDVGEGCGAWPGGPDEALMQMLTSVNIACGYHAGDPSTMRRTCSAAVEHGCVIGAHVGYPDLVGFGRRFMDMQPDELTDAVMYQLGALEAFACRAGGRVRYVKPHGALYNAIVHHERQASAVVAAVAGFDTALAVVGLPHSAISRECDERGVRFVSEGFADRAYTPEGLLVPRTQAGALITDPGAAAAQAVALAAGGTESVCVHSDTPGAPQLLASIVAALTAAGHRCAPFVL
jgi:UPF0271 protein